MHYTKSSNQQSLFQFFVSTCLLIVCFSLGLGSAFAEPLTLPQGWSGKASSVLLDRMQVTHSKGYEERIPVIVRLSPRSFALKAGQLPINSRLESIHSYSARLTAGQIEQLMDSDQVEYLTVDPRVQATSQATDADSWNERNPYLAAIGADRLRQMGLNGRSVTVAVFDSGISAHPALDPSRIRAAVDFTSGMADLLPAPTLGEIRDEYGHGTHVAGIIGASDLGVAPGADLVDVRVIGPDGSGLTSHVIRAIDWVIENKEEYGIRVANFSLSHPPVESCQLSPLCRAAERLVDAGILVVASAGNLGRSQDYPRIFGAIGVPGNSPEVITVYPVNTRGTASHRDDIATSYGSRGLSYIDNHFKPDLAAPGNRIPSLMAQGSFLAERYADQMLDDETLSLSGASMATPFVSGTAALMLQVNPDLHPHQIKAILLASAIKLTEPLMLEQGNGLVNARTAVQLAFASRLGTRFRGVAPFWVLDGELVWAGGAFVAGDRILYSSLVDSSEQPFWGGGVVWRSSVNWTDLRADSVNWTDVQADSVNWTDLQADSVNWTDFQADSVNWTDFMADSVNWTDFMADSVNWTDLMADSVNWTDLMADSVNWTDFMADSVNWTDFLADSVNWTDFQADSVNWTDLMADSVNWTDFQADSVNWTDLMADSVNWTDFQADSVNWTDLMADSVNWTDFLADSVNWTDGIFRGDE